MTMIENLQRENLHYLEEARVCKPDSGSWADTGRAGSQAGQESINLANKLRILKLSMK